MAKIEFNASKLKAIIDKSKEESAKRSNNDSSGARIAFLPEGKHKIRLFFDTTGELYRTAVTHKGPEGQVLCPDYLSEKDSSREYPECVFCRAAEEQDDWRLNRRFNIMTFGQLIQTDSPGDYWEAGNVYCIVGNTKYRKAIDSFLSSLFEDSSEYLMTLFDPQINGGYLSIDVTKGTQGSIAITVIPGKSAEAIPTEDWWKPLSEVWISPTFNDEKYATNSEAFLKELGGAPASEDSQSAQTTSETSDAESDESKKSEPEEVKPTTSVTQETAAPAPKVDSSNLAENQVIVSDGRTLTLPDEVVANKCWQTYDPSNPMCIICEVNADCMMASINK